MFFIFGLSAQEVVIEGVVLDAKTKEVLVNASVFNAKNTVQTSTDFDGKFTVKVKKGDELIFSYISYKTVKRIVSKSETIQVFLEPDNEELKEIIIVGNKNINDIDLRRATSAVATVKLSKIQQRASINTVESLQGQVAGVSVKTSGELGKPVKIRIRGTSTIPIKRKGKLSEDDFELLDNRFNQPLFVLDGQIISYDAFELLNINDIEQIKVLKDATANALYGVKASNGVIEITSKRGKNGKTEYSFSVQQGITFKGKPAQIMMNTQEKLAFERLSKNQDTPGYFYSEEYIRLKNRDNPNINQLIEIGRQKLDSIQKINTNWFDELARISTYQSYNISTRGGSKTNKFYISGNFSKQGGKFDGNDLKRFNGRLNYEYELSKKIYVMLNSGFAFSDNNTPNSSQYSPAQLMYELNPYEQKDKGKLISFPDRTFKNLVNQFSKNTKNSAFNFSTNINAELLKNLQISSVTGVQYGLEEALSIVPPTAYSEVFNAPVSQRGMAKKIKAKAINFTTNTRVNYQKSILKHNFSLSANMDYYKNESDFVGILGYGLPSKLSSGAGINNDIKGYRRSKTSSKKTTDATLGYGFSALYDWNNMLSIYGSFKKDASSLLPKEKRWNSFYAVGFAFNLDDNSFLKNVQWLQSLKFRSSYGKTASLAGITASLVVPTFGYGGGTYLELREFSLKDLFNENLRPEQNTSINLGLDINLINGFTLSVDAYQRRTTDMLLTVPVAPSNGFFQQLQNVGVMDNKGLELSFSTMIVKTDNFIWNISINAGYNDNKVIDLYEGSTLYLSDNPYPDYEEGKSANILYGLRNWGINPADGKQYFLRKDGTRFNGHTEKPNAEDFIVLGKTAAPFNGGWYHSFYYKNFQLSFDLYYSFGGVAKFTNMTRGYTVDDANKNLPKNKLKETWFEIGDEGKVYPNMIIGSNEFWKNKNYANTDNTGKTDFVRLNNIMIKYRFDKELLYSRFRGYVTNVSFYAQLKNVGYWSDFAGGDPESANVQGSAQPILTFGLNLGF